MASVDILVSVDAADSIAAFESEKITALERNKCVKIMNLCIKLVKKLPLY